MRLGDFGIAIKKKSILKHGKYELPIQDFLRAKTQKERVKLLRDKLKVSVSSSNKIYEKTKKGNIFADKTVDEMVKPLRKYIQSHLDESYYNPKVFKKPYKFTYSNERVANIGKARQVTATVRFNDYYKRDIGINDLFEMLRKVSKDYIKKSKLNPKDRIAMSIRSPNNNYNNMSWSSVSTFNPTDAIQFIENVVQSDPDLSFDDFEYIFKSHQMPAGGARKKVMNLDDGLKNKRCIIRITNDDDLCLARCLATALNKDHIKYNDIRQGRKIQQQLAIDLHTKADVPLGLCTPVEVAKFEDYIERNIIIVHPNGSIIYPGSDNESENNIYVLYHNNHYDLITSMKAFTCKKYYCDKCKKPFDKKDDHNCPYDPKCTQCRKTKCESIELLKNKKLIKKWIECEECNRKFPSEKCFENHKESLCGKLWKCKECKNNYTKAHLDKVGIHMCGYDICRTCFKYVDMENHKCYLQPPTKEHKTDNGYIYADFEATQETGTHEVNLFHAVLNKFNSDITLPDCNSACKWLITPEQYGHTVIMHNGQGYDFQFILDWLVKNGHTPFVIRNGGKITFMSIGHGKTMIRFVDSLNFLQMPLVDFSDTFDIKELKKGYFPHFFNKKSNQAYVGPLPPKEDYGYKQMKTKYKKKFDEWYEQNKDRTFDFAKEFREYCKSDVHLLREGCERLRKIFIDNVGVDPFQFTTIASCCMYIYRKKFMPENTIAIIEETAKIDRHSKQSIKWLEYTANKNNIKIQHALNGREHKVEYVNRNDESSFYRTDGYCQETKTVYEFNGCYYHGCPKCFNAKSKNRGITMEELLRKTNERKLKLESLGYKVESIWSCEWEKMSSKKEVKSILKTFNKKVIERLNGREGFFGGRTNASKLYFKASPTQKIFYVDFTSLYPYINFYGKYPIGHPSIDNNPHITDATDREVFGFVKCKVLPPRGLYHPVLPFRAKAYEQVGDKIKVSEKLTFPLCYSCVSTCQKACNHNDESRALIGVWTTPELYKAMDMGYEVLEAYETWHFEESSTELFKPYVEFFLKIKQENSSLPSWVQTDEDKQKYIDDYMTRQGIQMDFDKCNGKNNGLRQMAKICLNSLWGKFGQRGNKTQTVFIKSDAEFYKYITNDKIDHFDFNIIDENMMELNFNMKEDLCRDPSNTNIAVACFTTAYARLKLYSLLEELGDQVLYYDTDSVIYVYDEANKDHKQVETGSLLGELTDELEGKHIVEFCSTGPKSYAYLMNEPDKDGVQTVCKIKGFTLSDENSKKLNFETMKDIIFNRHKQITITNDSMITRSNRKLITIKSEKKFSFEYNKRAIQNYTANDIVVSTLPYGF